MFCSYIFILDEAGGRLLADASDNEISEIWEADLEEFDRLAGRLTVLREVAGLGKIPACYVKCRIELFKA